jgi:hypothetical protein
LRHPISSAIVLPWAAFAIPLLCPAASPEYERRVNAVRDTPGFVALWDFVKRQDGRFSAHAPAAYDFSLDAVNYVRAYWNEGRAATYDDFPLLGRGPFGQAVRFRNEPDPSFRPCLLVPRERFHDSRLDVKGRGKSVSMVVWLVREGGNHAIAGIWHEGTDLRTASSPATRVERGRRQYALFAGLAANNGASAVHLSENGASSFGDKYARNLAVTREVIPSVPPDATAEQIDAAWTVVGFSFDNARNTVTAYINGQANDYWIDNPYLHPFFKWPAEGWRQAHLRQLPGLQDGEDPGFPADQFYQPPERKPLSRERIADEGGTRVEIHRYEFTTVKVTTRGGNVIARELLSLRVNPFWFGHDLYTPPSAQDGGPFTIGRVIHSSRGIGFAGYIGAVAVFDRPISHAHMKRLSGIAKLGHLHLSESAPNAPASKVGSSLMEGKWKPIASKASFTCTRTAR